MNWDTLNCWLCFEHYHRDFGCQYYLKVVQQMQPQDLQLLPQLLLWWNACYVNDEGDCACVCFGKDTKSTRMKLLFHIPFFGVCEGCLSNDNFDHSPDNDMQIHYFGLHCHSNLKKESSNTLVKFILKHKAQRKCYQHSFTLRPILKHMSVNLLISIWGTLMFILITRNIQTEETKQEMR